MPSCEALTGAGCNEIQTCVGPPPGLLYDIYRDGVLVGQVCFTEQEAPPPAAVPVVTPGMVLREFRRLSWPAPELVVQPPGGRTLVNLPTIFHTTLSEPITQTVTLLGRQVSITATPESFTWHPGGGMPAWTTEDPGQPYSEAMAPEQHNHVVYLDAGGSVQAHVAVTYRGSYRIGNGPEQAIPETLTVAGAPVSMQVLEAQPKLVGTR